MIHLVYIDPCNWSQKLEVNGQKYDALTFRLEKRK